MGSWLSDTTGNVLSSRGLSPSCAFCMKTQIALPLAKLVSDYDAMEATVLQNIQETPCVGTQSRQITQANDAISGYLPREDSGAWNIVLFRHSNRRSSE